MKDEYSKTAGMYPNELDRTRMAASQARKDAIYRRIDNYCYQERRTVEEMSFASRAEQLKRMVRVYFIGIGYENFVSVS